MAQNPYYVSPPNALEALMLGGQAFDQARARVRQDEEDQAFKQAAEMARRGGLTSNDALSILVGAGRNAAPSIAAIAQIEKARQEANQVFGNPIYGTENGQTRVGTFDRHGNFRPINTGNFMVGQPVKTVDTGTEILGYGGKTGTPVALSNSAAPGQPLPGLPGQVAPANNVAQNAIPKNVRGAATEKEIGKETGAAQVALPAIESAVNNALGTIGKIRSHPGLPYAVGFQGIVPAIAGTSQRGAINLIEQAKGQTFLNAFNALRGGGQITEAEGAKATQALARLDRAQSMTDFKSALDDLEVVLKNAMQTARTKARGPQPSQAAPAQPNVVDYRTYFQGP